MVPETYKERWKRIYERARELYACQASSPEWRAPFQLLTAAFLYHKQAVTEFPADELHVRHYDPDVSWGRFGRVFGHDEIPPPTWRMDFASASFRLSTATFLLHQQNAGRHSPFDGLANDDGDDWKRNNGLQGHLDAARYLTRCRECSLDEFSSVNALRICAAMIAAHRDVFGHGEAGSTVRGWWGEHREQCYKAFYRCQLAEAQLRLIEWGFSVLPT